METTPTLNIKPFYKRSKFWLAIVSGTILILNEGLGWKIPTNTILGFAGIVIGYILGESYIDGQRAGTSLPSITIGTPTSKGE